MPDTDTPSTPVVLCFSGHDPSGGAGIQADIEAIAAHGGHAASIITALTTQDTRNIESYVTCDAQQILTQARLIAADMPIAAIKIGMLGGVEQALAVSTFLQEHPAIPVILDPVLAAGGGQSVAGKNLLQVINDEIIPRCFIITPNLPEARQLSGATDTDTAAQFFLAAGCQHVLITGTHDDSANVVHRLYTADNLISYEYPRLPAEYHGSGCTLASSLAINIAQNLPVDAAVQQALDYTWQCLKHARAPGRGQLIPRRIE